MPDKKLTDNEIKKALECCNQNDCKTCPYGKYNTAGWCCMPKLRKDTLDLINRLQAENTNLKGHLEQLKSRYDNAKAESERLNAKLKSVYKELERIALMTVETNRKELVGEYK